MPPAPSGAATGSRAEAVTLLAIAVGGALGSLARFGVGLALPHQVGGFPWATLLVNLTGAFGMGLLVAHLAARPGPHRLARPFLGVGVLGGWTTFSALALDVVQQVDAGHVPAALTYLGATFVVGVLALGWGVSAGRAIWRGASP